MQIAELDGQQRGSESLFVRFSMHPVKDEARSAAEGRPVYEEREYIEIAVPGDKQNAIHRQVRDDDRRRFSVSYQAWLANKSSEGMVGTPLEQWPVISSAQVQELAYFKCRTVEQLAGMSDANLRNVGPILELRKKAAAWLEAAKSAAPVARLTADLAERDARIAALEAQMKDLVEKFETREASGKSKK